MFLGGIGRERWHEIILKSCAPMFLWSFQIFQNSYYV